MSQKDKTTASRINGGNSAYGRSESDFYPTPAEATRALLEFLRLPTGTRIWEPACGEGHMVATLEDAGYSVTGTDIATGQDFLDEPLRECDWIITNPPFFIAEKFIERCAKHGKPFALLLKAQYWNAKRRYDLFQRIRPTYVLPLTWRPDFLQKKRGGGSPLMDVMWCVWNGGDGETRFLPLKKP